MELFSIVFWVRFVFLPQVRAFPTTDMVFLPQTRVAVSTSPVTVFPPQSRAYPINPQCRSCSGMFCRATFLRQCQWYSRHRVMPISDSWLLLGASWVLELIVPFAWIGRFSSVRPNNQFDCLRMFVHAETFDSGASLLP